MSLPENLSRAQYQAIDAINQIVMSLADPEAHAALLRVRQHLDARIEQTKPTGDWLE